MRNPALWPIYIIDKATFHRLVWYSSSSEDSTIGCVRYYQVIQLITPRILVQHLSLIAPSSVSNSVKDGGTFCGPQFFTFSSAKSHENCLHFKVAPVINDKKHPKHLVVTGALHVIQWIWGPQNHPSKSILWMRQLKKCARLLTAVKQWVTLWTFPHWPTPLIMVFLHCPAWRSNHLMEYWGTQVICHPLLNFLYSMSQGFLTKQLGLLTTTASFTITVFLW